MDLFKENKDDLLEEMWDEYSKEEEEFVLQTMFTQSCEFEQLSNEYKGFNCLCYYQEQIILKDIHFYDDLMVGIKSEKEYLISTDFNCIEVYIETEDEDEEGYVIIKDVRTERLC